MSDNINKTKKINVSTIIGIVICVLLIPILIINCTLLVKGLINKDKVPSFAGIFPMIVYTDSMLGTFESGDLIICKEIDAKDVKEKDIISYFDPSSKTNAVVTHKVRFITTDENGDLIFWTYGVANINKEFEDVTEMDCEKIPEKNLVGIYTGTSFGGLGNVFLFLQSTTGLILCVGIPVVALIAYDLIRRKLYENKNQMDKDELLKELEELRKLKEQKENNQENTTNDEVVESAE